MDAQVVSIDTNIVKSEGEVQLLLERLKQLEDEMKSQSTHNVKVVEEIITIFELLKDHLELEQLIRELDSQLSRDPVNVIKRYFFALSQQVNENLAEAEKHLRFLVVLDYLNPYFQVVRMNFAFIFSMFDVDFFKIFSDFYFYFFILHC